MREGTRHLVSGKAGGKRSQEKLEERGYTTCRRLEGPKSKELLGNRVTDLFWVI